MPAALDTITFIARARKRHGDVYDYSQVQYRSSPELITIGCKIHGLFEQSAANHLAGHGCRRCSDERNAKGRARQNSEFVFQAKRIHGDRYLYDAVNYESAHRKIKISCPEHGEFLQTPRAHLNGQGCPICGLIKRGKTQQSSTAEFIKKAQELHGIRFDYGRSEYVGRHRSIVVTCPIHGDFEQMAHNHLQGNGCRKCSHRISRMEDEIADFIVSLGFTVQRNRRDLISSDVTQCPLELDIFIPERNLAIEFCGIWWHSDAYVDDPDRHLKKLRLCLQADISLLTIFEDEWLHKRSQVEMRLMSALGRNQKIFARTLQVCRLEKAEANNFIAEYHLQGSQRIGVAYGLRDKDGRLMMVTTFAKPRFSKNYEWEMIRSCTRAGYTVVGGVSRLFTAFLREQHPMSVVTYADRRWGEGKSYLNAGFDFSHVAAPNYFYFRRGDTLRHSRLVFQKHKLPTLLKKFDSEKTEVQNMRLNDWYRIFDCGNNVFVYEKKADQSRRIDSFHS